MLLSSYSFILGYCRWVYQRYCEEMRRLSLVIFELLAVSLRVDRYYYKEFFEDGSSIMRCNNYPPCNNSGLTLGTGPHCDPTSLTILHQDEVGGLEVFANNKWQAIRPRSDAFVVNIGDTFMVTIMFRVSILKGFQQFFLSFYFFLKKKKYFKTSLTCLYT